VATGLEPDCDLSMLSIENREKYKKYVNDFLYNSKLALKMVDWSTNKIYKFN
jgi:hypothetical protein